MSILLSLVLAVLLLFVPLGRVSAQEATPAAETSVNASPVAVPAADCTVEARTVASIAEIVTDTPEVFSTPVADAGGYVRPDGTPADAGTTEGVSATVRQLVACINAGDYLRFLAVFSNDALRRYAVDMGLPLAPDDELVTPDPSQNAQIAIGALDDILVLADGRVNVLAHLTGEQAEDALVLQLTLVQQGDRWLIDVLQPIEPESDAWMPVSGNGYQGVIVSAADAPAFVYGATGIEPAQGWQPTAEQIATLESALPTFLAAAPNAAPDLAERLPTYLRQYAGTYDQTGQPVIFVNAFCDDLGLDWQSEAVMVEDGGDCFLSVIYVPTTGSFTDLVINGEA